MSVEEDTEADTHTSSEDRAKDEADRNGGQGMAQQEPEAGEDYHRHWSGAGPPKEAESSRQIAADGLTQTQADLQHH